MVNPHTCKKLWTKAEAAGAGSLHIRLAYSVMIPLENLKKPFANFPAIWILR